MKAGRPSTSAANGKSSSKRKESRNADHEAPWDAMDLEEQEDYTLDNHTPRNDFLDQSFRDDPFGHLGEDQNGNNRRPPHSFDTSSISSTLDTFSASDTSNFSLADQLDFFNPPENSNMNSTNGSLHLLSAQYPIDFSSFLQDYQQPSQQAQDLEPRNVASSFPGESGQTFNGALTNGSRSPVKTSSGLTLSDPDPMTIQQPNGNHHARPPKPGQAPRHQTFTLPESTDCWDKKAPCPPAPSQGIRHRRMQELASLSMVFYAQVQETTSPESNNNSTDPGSQPPFALAGKVLSSTTKFLHILTNLYSAFISAVDGATAIPTPKRISDKRKPSYSSEDETVSLGSPSSSSGDLNIVTPTSSRGCTEGNSPLFSVGPPSKDRHSRSAPKHLHSRKRTRSHSQAPHSTNGQEVSRQAAIDEPFGAEERLPADMTEVFALLTCYIRLLHLHSLLYAQIKDFVTSFPQGSSLSSNQAPLLNGQGSNLNHHSAPNLSSMASSSLYENLVDSKATPTPLFPGLSLDGVCLDSFAKFQIKFLLQITTHTLGEIEGVLGLPEGCRVSRRDIRTAENGRPKQRGILETGCVSKGFIEMTMKERGLNMELMGAGIGGGDRVMCIRDHLVELRKLLRGTINP